MKKNRVLFIPSSMRPGGESKFVLQYIRDHSDEFEFSVFSPDGVGLEMMEQIPSDVRIYNKKLKVPFFVFRCIAASLFRNFSFIIAGGRKGGLIGHIASFVSGKPVLYIPHGNHYLDSTSFGDKA